MNEYELGEGGLFNGLISAANAAAGVIGALNSDQAAATTPPARARTVPATAPGGVPVLAWVGIALAAVLGLFLVFRKP
jgi:LPXTG-motif cell wall-anchored protein